MPFKRRNAGKGHYYLDEDGIKLDSVTKMISEGLPKPALIPWSANTTAEYAIDHWAELSRNTVSDRLKKLKAARFAERDRAAKRGTEVHGIAERLIHGEEVDVPDEIAGHVEAYVRFLDTWQPKPLLVEAPVASRRWRYAGTLDMVIELPDGRVMVADIKTTRSGIYPETALQLAAYRYAEVYLDADGNEQPMSELGIVGALGIWVRSDGYDVHAVMADEIQHNKFLHVATVARWTQDNRDLISEALDSPEAAA